MFRLAIVGLLLLHLCSAASAQSRDASPETLTSSQEKRFNQPEHWKNIGGSWEFGSGTLAANGSEGPRLYWKEDVATDFRVSIDVRLDSQETQAGLVFRATTGAIGPDAFDGYYVGLNAAEETLVWGRCHNAWTPIARKKLPVVKDQWYRLTVQMHGSTATIWSEPTAQDRSQGDAATISVGSEVSWPSMEGLDQQLKEGRVGLRVLGGHATFRNFRVGPFAAAQRSTSFTNPVLPGCADPVVFRHDGVYYLYCTDTANFPNMPVGIRGYSSKDLVHWKDHGYVLKREDTWGEDRFWAPDIVLKDGVFHLYYAAETRICVATSASPLGPFRQEVQRPMEPETIRIDSHVFQDDDGQRYIYYVHFNKGNEIWGGRLNEDLVTVDQESLKPMIVPDQAWERQQAPIAEGPEIIKHNGTYYLTYSGSHFESPDYAVGYATSDSPLGPWKKSPWNPIMKSTSYAHGTAHHTLTMSPDGKEHFIVYHRHNNLEETEPRKLSIDRFRFVPVAGQPDRIEVFGPTSTPQPMPSGE